MIDTTQVTRAEYEALKKRVVSLEDTLLIILRQKATTARSAARRHRNLADHETRQYELFDGLAGDLDGAMTATGIKQ